jgi:3-oxoacyl-(acyl-carrier-protein) synthase
MIIGLVQRALRDAGASEEEVSQFHAEGTSTTTS